MTLQLKLLRRLKRPKDYELNANLGYKVSVSKMNKQIHKVYLKNNNKNTLGKAYSFIRYILGLECIGILGVFIIFLYVLVIVKKKKHVLTFDLTRKIQTTCWVFFICILVGRDKYKGLFKEHSLPILGSENSLP